MLDNLWAPTLALLMLLFCRAGLAQVRQENKSLSVNGHNGSADVVIINGRTYVELEALARIGKGSLSFNNDQLSLTLPAFAADSAAVADSASSAPSPQLASPTRLSHNFMVAGIEAIAEMREWASTLAAAIQRGYGVTENWVADYRAQAAHSLRLAEAAASTSSDRDGLQLLTKEFHSVEEWSDKLVAAKQSMDTAKYTSSPTALREEPLSQKIINCGHFLGAMLGSGEFKDDPSCH